MDTGGTGSAGEPTPEVFAYPNPDWSPYLLPERPNDSAPSGKRRLGRWLAWGAAGIGVVGLVAGAVIDKGLLDKGLLDEQRSLVASRPDAGVVPAHAPLADVAAVLARRTDAVRTANLQEFLADIDPAAREFRADQARLFNNLTKLPLATVSWKQNGDHASSAGAVASRYGVPTYVPAVQFSYQLKGFDQRIVRRPLALTFVQRDGRWLIASDLDMSVPRTTGPEPWEVAAIAVARAPHVLVIGTRADTDRLLPLARQASAALGRVSEMWPQQKKELTAVIYLPRDRESQQAYFPPSGKGKIDFDGIEFPVFDAVPGWFDSDIKVRESGTRIVLNLDLVGFGAEWMPELLAHEIAHVSTSRWTHAGAPRWLVEGAAEYTAFRPDPFSRGFPEVVFSAAHKGRLLKQLPSNYRFYSMVTGYDRSYLLCYYIVRTYGEDRLVELYQRAGVNDRDIYSAGRTKAAISKVLGVSQDKLLTDFNAWGKAYVRPA